MKKICNALVATGMFLIIGAAGGCDFESATLSQALIIMLCGFALCSFGLLMPKYITKYRRSRRALRKNTSKTTFSTKKQAPESVLSEAKRNFVLITEI